MDIDKIKSTISNLYEKGQRIVFWRDPDGEFSDLLPTLNLKDVSVIRIDETPILEAKVSIELEQPDRRFLIYETGAKPDPEDDWLLDIRLYTDQFAADKASMIIQELGLHQQSLRDHIASRSKFFSNKERMAKVVKLVQANDDELAIDLKIMATILRLEQADFFGLLRSLFHNFSPSHLDAEPTVWEEFVKYEVADTFWHQVEAHFGYAEDEPTLKNLLIRLLVTDLDQSTTGGVPNALQHLVLPNTYSSNAVVCIGQWRDSASRHESFDALSVVVAEAIDLDNHLSKLELDTVRDAQTFLLVEKHIASGLRDRVIDTAESLNVESLNELFFKRQDGYWANKSLPSSDDAPREALSRVYDSLNAATQFFHFRNQYQSGFSYSSAEALHKAYVAELFKFDQLYRHFCESADFAEAEGWDILKTLRDKIEDCYVNWFVANISMNWGQFVESQLIGDWKIDGVDPQQKFFVRHVQPVLDRGLDRRVFVIVSDAFRYEAAHELTSQLNGKYRFSADLSTLMGVLPSYTALGMAALLPHRNLSYAENGGVLVDGNASSGISSRGKVLESVNGVAIKADDLMAMNKADGREFIKSHRVVYIYHNQIDQTADIGNEEKTFNAVRTSIDEIANLVSKIVNNLNGNYIAITADHGFLFQESPPTELDKNAIAEKPAGTVISKKRYLLGQNLPNHSGVYRGSTSVTASADGDMAFWVPRGASRFHFVGGSRFVHGGAMLQEVVVPLIKVSQLKGKSAQKTKVRHVGVSVLNNNLKITTNRHKFRLIQTEAVTERIKPLTVKVAIFEDGEPVTNIETITFGSASTDMNDWGREVWLTLAKREFNKKNLYQLILRNAEAADAEVSRLDITIDLAFENDF